jgi:hypothetical protein
VLDNRLLIANLIQCAPDTPRVVGDADVFAIQDRVIEHILASAQEQRAVAEAPKLLDPAQAAVTAALREHLNDADVERRQAVRLLEALREPLPGVHVRALRSAYQAFGRTKDLGQLMATLESLPFGASVPADEASPTWALRREDLHLVCWEYVWS